VKLRRRIVITAASLLLGVGLLASIAVIWVMKTQSGMGYVKSRLEKALVNKVHGRIYLGNMSGPSINKPTIDSVEMRDMDDSVIFASGPISFQLDLLELWEKKIALHDVVIERPYFHLRRLATGEWNYKPMIRRDTVRTIPRIPGSGRKLGDYLVLESVQVRGGAFDWTDAWAPAKWLRGSARDSSARYNLARKDVDVQRIGGKLYKVRHWDSLEVVASTVRIKDPDRPGFSIDFSKLEAVENDPPFNLRKAHGSVSLLRDTVRVAIRGFRLPGSAGRAEGMLINKGGLAVRVRVFGDTVAMRDIAWLYPTMPTEGHGAMVLDILKDSSSDHIDYALSGIDVRSTKSRLRGAMTFGVGEEILALTDVDLDLVPVNFALIEQFAGGPLTLPWAGDLSGHVRARGGPLDQFQVDSAAITFTDANVPGAVNRFSGSGMLDIVRPALTKFYDFSTQVHHFDLRTARALDSLFPPLEGWIYGTARLDSIWTDIRLRDADIHYAADSASVSHFTGGGRVTVGETEMSYDLALDADPVNVGSFALSYPQFPLRGMFSGPFTVKGSIGSLELTGDLAGEGGRVRTSGITIDALPPKLGATGSVELTTIDLAKVLIDPPAWNGNISAIAETALNFDSLANMEGRARVRLAKSVIADLAMRGGYGSLTFGDGLMRVDSLNVVADAFALQGKGALGLRADRRDTLVMTTQLDSLGGFRRFIAPVVDTLPVDSLRGRFTATARLFGSLDSLGLRATANGTDVMYGTTTAAAVDVGLDLDDLAGRRVGTASLTARTMQALGIRFTGGRADARFSGDSARVTTTLTSETGPVLDGGAEVRWDSLSVSTLLDSLQISLDARRWKLSKPARILSSPTGFVTDTIELKSGDNARVSLVADIPASGELSAMMVAESFPLSDLGRLFQVTVPLSGSASMGASLRGTRGAPLMGFELRALNAGLGETRVEGLRVTGDYKDRELNAKLEYISGGATVMSGDAMLPMDLAIRPVARRMIELPMHARLDADTTDLAILKTLWSGIRDASGKLDVHLTAEGTWAKPQLNGLLGIHNGTINVVQLGLPYSDVRARIRFNQDSIVIDTLSARSEGTLSIFGFANLKDPENPAFTINAKAQRFHAIANPAIADLTVTVDPNFGLRLFGSQSSSTLVGDLTVNGRIFIPDTYAKNLIRFDPEYLSTIDTTIFANKKLLPPAPPKIVANMEVQAFTIRAGDNLTLKSAEANIGLAGALSLNVKPSSKGGQLDLQGRLDARGGTYRLNLGGFFQRTFAVDSGTIQFYGDPEREATMDIHASYTLRQYDQRDARKDIHVNANVVGTLSSPSVSLDSPDSRLSSQDLLSYLTLGTPSLEIGGRGIDYGNIVTAGLITSGASALSARVAGGACNFSTASVTGATNTGIAQTGRSILATTRLGCGIQLNEWSFFRLDLGFCALNQQIADVANTVGGKLDIRFANSLTLAVGFDPATSALTCTQSVNARGFVPTPRQIGGDIFKTWRW
jgi:translocation and assembly module TamB